MVGRVRCTVTKTEKQIAPHGELSAYIETKMKIYENLMEKRNNKFEKT